MDIRAYVRGLQGVEKPRLIRTRSKKSSATKKSSRFQLEQLEARTLLSADLGAMLQVPVVPQAAPTNQPAAIVQTQHNSTGTNSGQASGNNTASLYGVFDRNHVFGGSDTLNSLKTIHKGPDTGTALPLVQRNVTPATKVASIAPSVTTAPVDQAFTSTAAPVASQPMISSVISQPTIASVDQSLTSMTAPVVSQPVISSVINQPTMTQPISAAAHYVSTSGNDSNTGTADQPFGTIAKGMSSLHAGETLYIRGGTYDEAIRDFGGATVPSGSSYADAPVITSYPGEVATLRGVDLSSAQYVIFKDLVLDGAGVVQDVISVGYNGANHVRFQNIEAENSLSHLVTVSPRGHDIEFLGGKYHDAGRPTSPDYPNDYAFYVMGSNNLVDGIEVYNIPYYGIHNYDSSPTPSGNVYRNSVFHDTSLQSATGAAILLADGDSNVADNNTIYNNFGRGIETSYGASNTQITNNHIYQNGEYGILVASVNGSTNTTVSNNIVTENGAGQILDQGTATTLINNRTS
jgi:hypothetical protein